MKTLIFDTETTGLVQNKTTPLDRQPEIIEFYGAHVDLDTGEAFEEFETLIRPAGVITPEITRITGITPEMVKDESLFARYGDEIKDFIEKSDSVLAHNLSFDMDMVDLEYARLENPIDWPDEKICTVEQTVHLKGHRLTLMKLHELLFGEGFEKAHRARNDVNALIKCAVELRRREEI